MKLTKITIALLMWACLQIYAAPGGALRKAAAPETDKFSAIVLAPDESGTGNYNNVTPELKFDQKTGYHWYALKKTWVAGAKYKLVIKQAPASGIFYIFSVDGINNPKIYRVVNLDSVSQAGKVFPDSGYTFSLDYSGQERLCIWYTKKPVADYEDRILDIEMTKGEFTARNNGQLGDCLLRPADYWHFIKKEIGFATEQGKKAIPDTAVLPVIIEFDIK